VRSEAFAEKVLALLLGAASVAATQRERYSTTYQSGSGGGSGSGSGGVSGEGPLGTTHPLPMEVSVGFGLPWQPSAFA
jgi:hypothetical protein